MTLLNYPMSDNMHYESIVRFLLPSDLLDYFDITRVTETDGLLNVNLEEKNIQPKEYKGQELLSKGFSPEICIQDFPIRDKALFLHIKQRRWTIKSSGKIVSRNWELTAKGTRFTNEFGSFLKGLNR